MEKINENIIHLYNKWKEGYVRKETALEEKIKPMREWAENIFRTANRFEYTIDGIIVNGDLTISFGLKKFDFPFVECNGDFDIEDDFKNLKNCPKHVTGNFSCSYIYELESLKGAPEEVGGTFDCTSCDSIKSLKGAPKKVKNFDCSLCSLLTSLVGAPEIVTGDFTCWNCDSLTTLKGAPEKVGGDFKCVDCDSLTSIEDLPKEIGGDLHIDWRFNGKIPENVIIKGNIEWKN